MKHSNTGNLHKDVLRLLENLGTLPQSVDSPIFFALSGLPGTGKSYFSRQLAARVSAVILESDALRKVLFPRPTYEWWENARLFRAIYYLIEDLLNKRISVILDATNLIERHRRKLNNIAKKTNARFVIILLKAPANVVRKRLEERSLYAGSYSDADWKVYQDMKRKAEKIRQKHYIVDTTKDIVPVINSIIEELAVERSTDEN